MTPTANYSTRELIELSLLDAMGLLDEDERDRFERSFTATSPAIQAHIRREQTRLAQIDFLPDVEPAADLRAAVLEAVRKAMAEEPVKHRVRARTAFVPAMLPSRRVSPLWRAGAVGFATAAVVFGVTTLHLKQGYDTLQEARQNNEFVDLTLQNLGSSFEKTIFNENTRHVMFKPTAANTRGSAVLLLDTETRQASLVCERLPAADGQTYQLVVMNTDGTVGESLAAFTSTGLTTKPLKVKLSRGMQLAILAPADASGATPAILQTDPLSI